MANDAVSLDHGSGARRIAVVVVHGVGDTEPGVALNEVVDALQAHFPGEIAAERYCEVYPLASPPIKTGDPPDSFVAYARTARLQPSGDQVRFYDLHWADMTRILPGRFNAFLGSFRIIFESHHFVDAMLPKDGGPLTRSLRGLLIWAAAILRGPIVGASACLVAAGLAFYFSQNVLAKLNDWFFDGAPESLAALTVGMVIAVMGCLFLAALVLFYRRAQSRETEWNDVLVAILIGSAFVAGYTWLLYAFPNVKFLQGTDSYSEPMCRYLDRFHYLAQSARAFWYLFLIAALALVGWLYVFKRRSETEVRPSAAMAATSIVVLQSAFWLAILSSFALPIINQAKLHNLDCKLDGLFISFAGTALLLGNAGWLVFLTYMTRASIARMPFMSLERRDKMMPRLLFGGVVTLAILTGAIAQAVVFAVAYAMAFTGNNELFRTLQEALQGTALSERTNDLFAFVKDHRGAFYAPMGAVAVGVSMLIAAGATTAVHIARDLIDHHYSPRLGYSHYLLPKRWRVSPRRPRRQRIRERLNTLARDVICREPVDSLIFVVHSQGSVIAYDYLRFGGQECEQLLCARPHLITFGSPLGHLYQYYFKEYAQLGEGIAALRPRLSSWTNLYRVDDYVGREIASAADKFVDNRLMAPGGHKTYWRDRLLSEILLTRMRAPVAATA